MFCTVTWVRTLAGEVHDSRAAQRHDAGARVIQGSILVRHDALTRHVGVQQHMVGFLARPKSLCVPGKLLQQWYKPPAEPECALKTHFQLEHAAVRLYGCLSTSRRL